MKRFLLLSSLLFLILVLFIPLRADFSLQGRTRPGKEFRRAYSALEHPLYLYWYQDGEDPLAAEMDLYLQSLQRKGMKVYRRVESPALLEQQGFYPYAAGEQSHYSGFVLEYLGFRYTVPLMLDPLLLEERLLAGIGYLQEEKPPKIALITGDWEFPAENSSTLMVQALQAYGTPLLLNSLVDLPEDCSLILLQGHRDLTLLDIDILQRFIEKGGSLLVCLSPFESDPDRSDRLLLRQKSPFMQWLEEQGIALEPQLILHRDAALPLVDGSPYPAWTPLQTDSAFSGLNLLWGSPLSIDPSLDPEYLFQTTPGAIRGGQLESLAPMDLYREWDGGNQLPEALTAGLILKEGEGTLAVFGSRWMFSDLVLQSGSEMNLEVLNGLILYMSGQEEVFSFRQSRMQRASSARPGPVFILLHLLVIPLLLVLLPLPDARKRKTPWPE